MAGGNSAIEWIFGFVLVDDNLRKFEIVKYFTAT